MVVKMGACLGMFIFLAEDCYKKPCCRAKDDDEADDTFDIDTHVTCCVIRSRDINNNV